MLETIWDDSKHHAWVTNSHRETDILATPTYRFASMHSQHMPDFRLCVYETLLNSSGALGDEGFQ
jgi:hypothetical protein